MNIMRRAARVIAALLAAGRVDDAKTVEAGLNAHLAVKPRGPKYRPAVQIRGGLCTIGSHDAGMRAVLAKRRTTTFLSPRRARDSSVYQETLAELGVRKS